MPDLIQIVFFYMLANIGATTAFFVHHKTGWLDKIEPIVMAICFMTIGIGWSVLVAGLNWFYRRHD
jgi:hypothetical protein